MKNMKKKGFTLVELLVVIAIVAILAVVSVVGYTVFINRANLSNDQTTIEMINDNLTAVTIGKEINTAGDALTFLREANIYGEKLEAYTKGHHYVFDLNNKAFVLVNEKGEVVYPANVKNADLWALYSNDASDKVEGVTQYVATESVWYKSDADKVFNATGFVVDLNGHAWSVDLLVDNAVTVKNGYVADSLNGVSVGDGAAQIVAFDEIPADGVIEGNLVNITSTADVTALVAKIKANDADEIKFSGCVISVTNVITISGTDVDLVFENCVFTSSNNAWTIEACNSGDLTIKDCTFNGARGVNIGNGGAVVIENNTFNVEKHCLQLAGGKWDSVTIKNNNFISGQGIARVHANMLAKDDHGTCDAAASVGTNIVTTSLDTFKSITFDISGNTFAANFNAQFYSDCEHVDEYTAYVNTKIAK